MERKPFVWREMFTGNWEFFQKVLSNPKTIIVYDIDGILLNSPDIVLKRFTEKTGIKTNPAEIDRWDYLTSLAKNEGLSEDEVKHAEDGWYDPMVLSEAKRYLYIRPVIRKTVSYHGPDHNFVLTSRNPYLKQSTIESFDTHLPEIKTKNILIRESGGIDKTVSAAFKVENLRALAKIAPWILFVDDSVDFCEAVIKADIENCVVVNIPLGKIMPDYRHERLIVIKRFPDEIQAMYPLMFMLDKALVAQSY